jgi:hypothetical protein
MADVAHALRRLHEEHDTSGTREATAIAAAPRAAAAEAPRTVVAPKPDPDPMPPAPPEESTPRRRRGGLLAMAVVLLLAAVAVGGYLLLAADGDEVEPRANPDRSSSSTPSNQPSDDATPEDEPPTDDAPATEEPTTEEPTTEEPTTEEPTEEPEEEEESSSSPAAAGLGSRARFVEGYYGALPDDTETGWSLLTPGYQQETSRDTYEGFWSGIDAVTVEETRAAGSNAVDVTLTYTSGGGTQREVRRVFLERGDDGYLISGSEIVG